jgi:hypothetical protein
VLPSMIDMHALLAVTDPGRHWPADCIDHVEHWLAHTAGARLPSEELMGTQPAKDPARRRAYLSNVCVAHSARRQVPAFSLQLCETGRFTNGTQQRVFVSMSSGSALARSQ